MSQIVTNKLLPVCLMSTALLVGCQSQTNPPASDSSDSNVRSSSAEPKPIAKDKRFATAVKAKDALFQKLSGRLMEVMKNKGAVAAIHVCSQEAAQIAATVGQEYGVEIGRTSFKLRNPGNAPRDWVQPIVAKRVDTPQQMQLANGNLGAVFPIRLDVKCLMCHGGPDDILEDVKLELAKLYPADQATGFQQGDLRGWFWVEVPRPADNDSAETGNHSTPFILVTANSRWAALPQSEVLPGDTTALQNRQRLGQ